MALILHGGLCGAINFIPYAHVPQFVTLTEIALSLSYYAFLFFCLVDKLLVLKITEMQHNFALK